MSARAISRWLEDNQGIKFSAASVAKVLRNQERHFKQIVERVQPLAEHIANSSGVDVGDILRERFPDPRDILHLAQPPALSADDYFDFQGYVERSANELRREWFSLDREMKISCLPYFDFEPEDTKVDE